MNRTINTSKDKELHWQCQQESKTGLQMHNKVKFKRKMNKMLNASVTGMQKTKQYNMNKYRQEDSVGKDDVLQSESKVKSKKRKKKGNHMGTMIVVQDGSKKEHHQQYKQENDTCKFSAIQVQHKTKVKKRMNKKKEPPINETENNGSINANWKVLQATLKAQNARRRVDKRSLQSNKTAMAITSDTHTSSDGLDPRSSDNSLTNVLAMDCEMVGAGMDGKKNILARVSLVNAWGNTVYDKYVWPIEQVTDLRTRISGVRAQNLRKGEAFKIVQKEVADLICGRVLVGHSLKNDLKILYLSHPKKYIRDTSIYPPLRSNGGHPQALKQLAAQILGARIQEGEHCSVQDARAAMYIYQHLRKDWETFQFCGRKQRPNKI